MAHAQITQTPPEWVSMCTHKHRCMYAKYKKSSPTWRHSTRKRHKRHTHIAENTHFVYVHSAHSLTYVFTLKLKRRTDENGGEKKNICKNNNNFFYIQLEKKRRECFTHELVPYIRCTYLFISIFLRCTFVWVRKRVRARLYCAETDHISSIITTFFSPFVVVELSTHTQRLTDWLSKWGAKKDERCGETRWDK